MQTGRLEVQGHLWLWNEIRPIRATIDPVSLGFFQRLEMPSRVMREFEALISTMPHLSRTGHLSHALLGQPYLIRLIQQSDLEGHEPWEACLWCLTAQPGSRSYPVANLNPSIHQGYCGQNGVVILSWWVSSQVTEVLVSGSQVLKD